MGSEHGATETLLQVVILLAALDLTRLLLTGLGTSPVEAARLTETFKDHDRKRLYADYVHYTDLEKMTRKTREAQKELEELFATDLAQVPKNTADGRKG